MLLEVFRGCDFQKKELVHGVIMMHMQINISRIQILQKQDGREKAVVLERGNVEQIRLLIEGEIMGFSGFHIVLRTKRASACLLLPSTLVNKKPKPL